MTHTTDSSLSLFCEIKFCVKVTHRSLLCKVHRWPPMCPFFSSLAHAHWAHMHNFLSVRPSGFVEATLCTTSMAKSFIVHHLPGLCTTDLLCAPGCTQETYFLSPPVHFAWWAHMRRFLSVRLSGLDQKSDWIIIHISESIKARTLKLCHIIEHC